MIKLDRDLAARVTIGSDPDFAVGPGAEEPLHLVAWHLGRGARVGQAQIFGAREVCRRLLLGKVGRHRRGVMNEMSFYGPAAVKHQAPSSKLQTSTKSQMGNDQNKGCVSFGSFIPWCFGFVCDLMFVFWCFTAWASPARAQEALDGRDGRN